MRLAEKYIRENMEVSRSASISGKTWVEHYGPWGLPLKAAVLCADGVIRVTSGIHHSPSTLWTLPASLQVKGKTVSGEITWPDGDHDEYRFFAHGKNRDMIKSKE